MLFITKAIKLFFSCLACHCILVISTAAAPAKRIDPAGISGALVLSGGGLPDANIDRFNELAGGSKMHVLVLCFDESKFTRDLAERIVQRSAEEKFPVTSITVTNQKPAAVIAAVNMATGVWLLAQDSESIRNGMSSPLMHASLYELMDRGGVIGGHGVGCSAFAADGLALLPGSVISSANGDKTGSERINGILQKRPSLVGYEIDEMAALVVNGRRITVAGTGGIVISLAPAGERKLRMIKLKGRDAVADLSALRFSALARSRDPFPVAKPPSPRLAAGTLIIIGGGGMPRGIISQFVEKAGGDDASIVVLPTAMPDPIPSKSSIADAFRRAGAGKVTVLKGRKLNQVESEEYLSVLREATGIWFGGGRQWRFADAYLDTRAHALMHKVLARGGVIMGSSAGASIQADYLARANPLGNRDIVAEGYERGLGFIKGVAIDQHFAERKRFKDMSQLVTRYPQLLGIGIDEGTALIVEGEIGSVSGKGSVHFYNRRKPLIEGSPDYESVHDGGRYHLVRRSILNVENP